MDRWKWFFYFLSFIGGMPLLDGSYLYGEWDGRFSNDMSLLIHIGIKDVSNAIIVFGSDTDNNTFSIRTDGDFENNRNIIIQFNNQTFKITAIKMDWGSWFGIDLRFKKNNLYGGIGNNMYKNYDIQLHLRNVFNGKPAKDSSKTKSDPNCKCSKSNKIRFWLGSSSNESSTLFNQSVGCIDRWFHINKKPVQFTQFGHSFSQACRKLITETICNQKYCYKKSNIFRFLECGVSSMNTNNHCFEDLPIYTGKTSSFKNINLHRESTSVKLAWRQKLSHTHCLIDIQDQDDSSMLIFTDHWNQVIMQYNHGHSNLTQTILHKFSLRTVGLIQITFDYPNVELKIANSLDVKVYRLILPFYPQYIHVGFSLNSKVCRIFSGEISLQYNLKHFQSVVSQSLSSSLRHVPFVLKNLNKQIPMVIITALLLVLLLCLILIISRFSQENRKLRNMLLKSKDHESLLPDHINVQKPIL